MRIGIPREILDSESRIAATSKTVEQLQKLGFTVLVESGAGKAASFSDAAYQEAGAEISADTQEVWGSEIVMKVNAPLQDDAQEIDEIALLFGCVDG